MTTSDYTEADFYSDHAIEIDERRVKLIAELNTALGALQKASTVLTELCSNQVYDLEFAEGTAGDDVSAFIADSLRYTRAAYTVTHDITERR
ncbi:hypothetical protein [Mycobacterium aquaticum]|uniref:Uncharacterized protein n=1 Tax=Mycobacterium aquaticum TaxID=1927124 RepID=A0A1X0AGX7_9MYCO|nr:hypothetical protein [Mycobacterium aquaticum]ORA29294.1 hypothetical protein BST13_27305 [Mycobacterium aquaticum]